MNKNNELRIYDYVFDPEQMSGIKLIALVENPATEILAVQLSKEIPTYEFKLASEEERILVSPILIPDQLIYRSNINGEPAYVKASKETIAKLQEHFVSMGYQKNANIEHQGDMIDGIVFTEQWIVRNSEQDTINAYGFENVPVGSWCVKAKLSQELWTEYVKTGKIKAFSVEGMLGIKLSNNNEIKLKKMDKQTIEQIVLSAIKSVALASDLIDYKDADGKSYFASSLEVGSIVTDADGGVMANAEFVIEDKMYKTDDMGAIASVEDVMKEEEVTPEVEVEIEQVDEVPVVEDVVVEDDVQALKDKISEQEAMIAELETKLIDAEAKLVEAEAEKVEMSNQTPASTGIKDVPNTEFVSNKNESLFDTIKRLR